MRTFAFGRTGLIALPCALAALFACSNPDANDASASGPSGTSGAGATGSGAQVSAEGSTSGSTGSGGGSASSGQSGSGGVGAVGGTGGMLGSGGSTTGPSSGSGGASVAAIFQTSFTTADGWSTDRVQVSDPGSVCNGQGFAGIQTGVGDWGHWVINSSSCDTVTTAANFSLGAGGRGFRHWQGDGLDVDSGGLSISFAPQPEVWLRWYERYQAGFKWVNGEPQFIKEWYVDVGHAPANAIGITSNGGYGTTEFYPVSRNISNNSIRWHDVYGSQADGKFHCFIAHLKTDTNGSNGVFEFWADGSLAISVSDVNWAGASFDTMAVENQNNPNNGGPAYRDYDDIAISTTASPGCPYPVGP